MESCLGSAIANTSINLLYSLNREIYELNSNLWTFMGISNYVCLCVAVLKQMRKIYRNPKLETGYVPKQIYTNQKYL